MSRPAGTKGERTRARILEAASTLFARSGFNAVSLREIAAQAGMTHAGLLHHFPGKESLLLEVLSIRDREDAAWLFPGLLEPGDAAEPTAVSAAERFWSVVDLTERNSRTPGLVALYTKVVAEAAAPDHPAHAYFVRRYQVLRRELGTLLAAALREADPPVAAEPEAVAQQLLALMDGLQTQWVLEPDRVPMRRRVEEFLALYGLRPAHRATTGPVTG
ncbi:TetR/AcrR family transcriptional regulator [Streptomyces sp. NPDC057694]|uniref:TetR/AcrR family transcriptional regulator n=1 Tax=Streptomyces sp. NPDC057694 TaxID=3346216 RepID=UPI003678B450